MTKEEFFGSILRKGGLKKIAFGKIGFQENSIRNMRHGIQMVSIKVNYAVSSLKFQSYKKIHLGKIV